MSGWHPPGFPERTGPAYGPARRGPAPERLVVSVARHPSFTPDRAARVVAGLTWQQLCNVWAESARAQSAAGTPEVHLALVVLRAAVLDEMERLRPSALDAWFAAWCVLGCGSPVDAPQHGWWRRRNRGPR